METSEGRSSRVQLRTLRDLALSRDSTSYDQAFRERTEDYRRIYEINQRFPGAFAPVVDEGRRGVGGISHAAIFAEDFRDTFRVIPLVHREKSLLQTLHEDDIVVFGRGLGKTFCYLYDNRNPYGINSTRGYYSDRSSKLFVGSRIDKDLVTERELYDRLKESDVDLEVSPRDALRLLNLRLLQLQRPRSPHPNAQPSTQVVLVLAPNPIPPNEGRASAALTFDGRTIALQDIGVVSASLDFDGRARDRQRQIDESRRPKEVVVEHRQGRDIVQEFNEQKGRRGSF